MAAFSISSNTVQTKSTIKSLYDFLNDFKNFSSILPADKVENFQYTENGCSFNIKGITPMSVKRADVKPYEFILFKSEGLAKFNFDLKVIFTGTAESPGSCAIELSGNMNPFIKTMAEKPLGNLVNTMSEKLSELKVG